MRKRLAVGALGVVGLTLAGCGGSDKPTIGAAVVGTTSSTAAGQDANAVDFNAADVTFAQMIIVQREHAIAMARLADGRANSYELLDLAARIETAQRPEIEQMRSLLTAWGEPEAVHRPNGQESTPGEMTEQDIVKLRAATGKAFDRLFLETMIDHHRGAMQTAATEARKGSNQRLVHLDRKLIEEQEGEIREMERLLSAL